MLTVFFLFCFPIHTPASETVELRVSPASISIRTPESMPQILVTAIQGTSKSMDATRLATFESRPASLVTVTPTGRVIALADGSGEIIVQVGNLQTSISVTVDAMATPEPVSFEHHVVPLLTKAGCNSGGCHGKAEGQQGFKLSVFGYDPESDYEAIVLASRGRRVIPGAPERSLLLEKGSARIPHGGGQKIIPDSAPDRMLSRWIHEGANGPRMEEIFLANSQNPRQRNRLIVEPQELTLMAEGQQQLRVTLRDDAGFETCVTAGAQYQSNDDTIAMVDDDGLVTATDAPGGAAILVRYQGDVAVCRVTRPRDSTDFERPIERNFVDRLVWDRLEHLHLQPSPLADDATFLRRVYLDVIGTLPTAREAREFLNSDSPNKRTELIHELLNRTEYADYWGQRWSDWLQIDKDTLPPQSAIAMTRWVRDQFAQNVPYDAMVQAILTAEGSILEESPAGFFAVQENTEQAARAISQLFLGVRIECAQCHHHPFEHWDQTDYFALAGFFSGVQRTNDPLLGTKIIASKGIDLQHPRTGRSVPAAVLGAPPIDLSNVMDRREAFSQWATSAENPYFAKLLANRLWAHYFGRGLVEPIDDMRATNPAVNEPLLQALADHLVETGFNIKAFTATLLDSAVYQLSTEVNESNRLDDQNQSHASWKPLPAEVLLDAISQVTGVPESFNGWPAGYRAIQIWDNKLPSHFLEVFGRPRRLSVCACERGSEPSMAQVLHLMNSQGTAQKLADRNGRAAALAKSNWSDNAVLEELYLTALTRLPTASELELTSKTLRGTPDRQEAIEDILWMLMNTKEFVFNH